VEDPRFPPDVYGAQERGERALGESALHLSVKPRENGGTAPGV
jgi:hypothetical protein